MFSRARWPLNNTIMSWNPCFAKDTSRISVSSSQPEVEDGERARLWFQRLLQTDHRPNFLSFVPPPKWQKMPKSGAIGASDTVLRILTRVTAVDLKLKPDFVCCDLSVSFLLCCVFGLYSYWKESPNWSFQGNVRALHCLTKACYDCLQGMWCHQAWYIVCCLENSQAKYHATLWELELGVAGSIWPWVKTVVP